MGFQTRAKLGAARDLATKFAAQDSTANQVSATGESKGLSFADSGESGGYDQGLKARQSSSEFLHHGKKNGMTKGEPNPFIGKHAADWGVMLQNAQTYLSDAPWLAIFPGVMIVMTVLCFHVLGDHAGSSLAPDQTLRY